MLRLSLHARSPSSLVELLGERIIYWNKSCFQGFNLLNHWSNFITALGRTVDGRNPANQLRLVSSLSHYLQGFLHARWLAGFQNHQQYHDPKWKKVKFPCNLADELRLNFSHAFLLFLHAFLRSKHRWGLSTLRLVTCGLKREGLRTLKHINISNLHPTKPT